MEGDKTGEMRRHQEGRIWQTIERTLDYLGHERVCNERKKHNQTSDFGTSSQTIK